MKARLIRWADGDMTAAEYKALGSSKGKPRKYRNVPVEVNGEKFRSKLEAKVYADLCREYGESNVLREVSIQLGQGKRMRIDFVVIEAWRTGDVYKNANRRLPVMRFIDAKGKATEAWKLKAAWLLDKRGIEIELRTK